MGSGASAAAGNSDELCTELIAHKSKPVDCSDVKDDIELALGELSRLRQILQIVDVEKMVQLHNSAVSTEIEATSSDEDYAKKLLEQIKLKMDDRFQSLRKVFRSIDVDNSGFISRNEFKDSCAEWGVMIDDEDFDSLDKLYPHQESSSANNKGINYLEFIAMMTKQVMYEAGEGEGDKHLDEDLRKKVLGSHDTMKKAFAKADRDSSGSLNKDELKELISYYQIEFCDSEFDKFFKLYDVNGDGAFSYHEFVKLMQHQEA